MCSWGVRGVTSLFFLHSMAQYLVLQQTQIFGSWFLWVCLKTGCPWWYWIMILHSVICSLDWPMLRLLSWLSCYTHSFSHSFSFCFPGTGRSKRTSKRNAAANMLAQLQSLSSSKEVEKQIEDSDEEEEDIPLVGLWLSFDFACGWISRLCSFYPYFFFVFFSFILSFCSLEWTALK